MNLPQQVHMVPVADVDEASLDRVVEPPQTAGADLVYLLADDECDADLLKTVRTRLRDAGVTVVQADIDHANMYDMAGLVTTVTRRHSDDEVFVNAATGDRIAAIGAVMGVMDSETDVRAYLLDETGSGYEPYTIDEPGEMGFVEASIDAPTRTEIASMAVIFAQDESKPAAFVKRWQIISKLVKVHPTLDDPIPFINDVITSKDNPPYQPETLADEGFRALSRNDQKRTYRLLKNRVVGVLKARGYLTVEPHGQSDSIELTSAGEQALKVYRHEVADVIDALADELSTRPWPEWFEQGYAPPEPTGGTGPARTQS